MSLEKLTDRFEDISSRQMRADPIRAPMTTLALDEKATGKIQYAAGGQVQYELVLRIGTTYWANQAQHFDARMNAERAVKECLYQDVARQLVQLRSLLDSTDRHSAQLFITEMLGELRP